MSELFQNAVYVPTGQSEDKDFIRISGYCYKKVSDNITVLDTPLISISSDTYQDCLDCNTCRCDKQIDFIVGGYLYSGADVSYAEKIISINTSSKGWQEIGIESGYLNINPFTKEVDSRFDFKPAQIKCYDRKIDISGGIFASFDDRNAEIAHFKYVTGADLYERENLLFLSGDDNPDWAKNQYDKVGLANKLNTIKFRSLCEYDCPTQDITFRIRGEIKESDNYVNYGNAGDSAGVTSWVYAACTGVPTTPGQIIECVPSGNGIDLTEYFTKGNPPFSTYLVEMENVNRIEVVNMPLLLGETGSDLSKFYSISGSGSLEDEMFGIEATSRSLYYNYYSGFYYLNDGGDDDVDYSSQIGSLGIDYNKPPNCHSFAITGSDFNRYYRHIGANTIAAERTIITDNDGSSFTKGDVYTGCYQASEYIDGIFKVGTYNLMKFTGIITGNADEYNTFIDNSAGATAPEFWSSGVYVYQWYKSGDQSDANSNIDGYFGFLHDLSNPDEQLRHFESVASNHSPVNMGDPLVNWDVTSGIYPPVSAEKINSSIILNFARNSSYQVRFSMRDGSVRHYARRQEEGDSNIYDNYLFEAASQDSAINYLDVPEYSHNTFIKTTGITREQLLIDSGNFYHQPNATIDNNQKIEIISGIKFQLSWNK